MFFYGNDYLYTHKVYKKVQTMRNNFNVYILMVTIFLNMPYTFNSFMSLIIC